MRPRRPWPVLVAAAAIVAVVATAWLLQAGLSGGGESSKNDSPPPYSIAVKRGGEVLKTYDLAALRALPQASRTIDGKEQEGPLLTTLLDDAGAGGYQRVEVRGAAIRDSGLLVLTAARVARRVQLDFSDRGTAKCCGPRLEREEWVRDVLTINAE